MQLNIPLTEVHIAMYWIMSLQKAMYVWCSFLMSWKTKRFLSRTPEFRLRAFYDPIYVMTYLQSKPFHRFSLQTDRKKQKQKNQKKNQTNHPLTLSILKESSYCLSAQERVGPLLSTTSRKVHPPSCRTRHGASRTRGGPVGDLRPA